MLKETVEEQLYTRCELQKGAKIGVAVSGGMDSMTLLSLCLEIAKEGELSLTVLHFEHGIRGEESQRDARFVEETAGKMGLPFRLGKADVPARAKEDGRNIEEEARLLRYAFFRDCMEKEGLCAVAVAHHADDDVEGFLLNLLRGSGKSGLLPMRARTKDGIIRPMLCVSKAEIREYAEENGIAYVEDSTNADESYTRNYIRRELVPRLKNINPKATEKIMRTQELLLEEEEILLKMQEEAEKEILSEQDGDVVLKADLLNGIPAALRRRVVRTAIGRALGTLKDISFDDVDAVLRLGGSGTGKTYETGRFFARVSYNNTLIIGRKFDTIKRSLSFSLTEGETRLWDGESIFIEEAACPSVFPGPKEPVQFVKREALKGAQVRTRCPGDRIVPFGMKGSKKIGDWMTDEKVPLPLRENIPLLAVGDEVLWIIGYGLSEKLRVNNGDEAVKICYKKQEKPQ